MKRLAIVAAGVALSGFAVVHTANASESTLFSLSCGPRSNSVSCAPSGLVSDPSGNLYGETQAGGSGCGTNLDGCGTVFELVLNQAGGYSYRQVYSFCSQLLCADGEAPSGGLILDTAGNLYGTTQGGGRHQRGVVFRLTPGGGITTLYDFCSDPNCAAGDTPTAGLTYLGTGAYDGSSPLFGTTSSQFGSGMGGTVYEIPSPGNVNGAVLLHAFNCPGQSCQPSALVSDAYTLHPLGNLYGATTNEGTYGNLYELQSEGSSYVYNLIYSFCQQSGCSDGQNPSGSLVLDYLNNLYGTTQQGGQFGGGEGYEITSIGGAIVKLWPFCANCGGIDTGVIPVGGLAAAGPPPYQGEFFLYGTTSQAGTGGLGTVFLLPEANDEPFVCHNFNGGLTDGGTPESPVIVDASGNIFGTTSASGLHASGIVFKAGC